MPCQAAAAAAACMGRTSSHFTLFPSVQLHVPGIPWVGQVQSDRDRLVSGYPIVASQL